MSRAVALTAAAVAAISAFADVSFDAGADMRIRQEIFDNATCLPGDGVAGNHGLLSAPGVKDGKYTNRLRFRPRVWGEVSFGEKLRIYSRLTDEFRWNVQPNTRSSVFPDEVFLDNLFIE